MSYFSDAFLLVAGAHTRLGRSAETIRGRELSEDEYAILAEVRRDCELALQDLTQAMQQAGPRSPLRRAVEEVTSTTGPEIPPQESVMEASRRPAGGLG